jgi:hypothetical protein
MITTILSALDPAKLASIKSSLISDGIRRIPVDQAGEIQVVNACGATLTLRFRAVGQVDISHDEIAALSGKTREQIDALTAVEVEQAAPFLAPVLAKVQAVAADAAGYAHQWPSEPWKQPEPIQGADAEQ